MDGEKFFGIGGMARELGLSNSRVRQLEDEGVIPPSRRLVPGDRRIWGENEVEAARQKVRARRRAIEEAPLPAA